MGVNAKAILTGETATLDLLEFIYGCKASSNVRLVPTGDGGFRLCFNWLNESSGDISSNGIEIIDPSL